MPHDFNTAHWGIGSDLEEREEEREEKGGGVKGERGQEGERERANESSKPPWETSMGARKCDACSSGESGKRILSSSCT